jgi:hypothetical protein
MRFKRTIIACVAAAGMGGLAFGGSAVATSFTSTSQRDTAEAQGASTGIQLANGTFDAQGLVPGATPVNEGPVAITNTGNVSGRLTITFGNFTVNQIGSDGTNPDADDLIFNIPGLGNVTAAFLSNRTIYIGHLSLGQEMDFPVTVALAAGTGNNWNGADAELQYSVTLTAGT